MMICHHMIQRKDHMILFHLQMTPNIFDVISSLMNSNFVTNYLTSTVLAI